MTGDDQSRSDRLECCGRAIGIANINLSLQTKEVPARGNQFIARADVATTAEKPFFCVKT
jgi:hypothetical protein